MFELILINRMFQFVICRVLSSHYVAVHFRAVEYSDSYCVARPC